MMHKDILIRVQKLKNYYYITKYGQNFKSAVLDCIEHNAVNADFPHA